MSHHKIYSELMSIIQDEFFIRPPFYNFFIHIKNIKDLISKFESNQQDRVYKNQNNLMGNFNQHHISQWYSDTIRFSFGHQAYTDWETKYACCARILLN